MFSKPPAVGVGPFTDADPHCLGWIAAAATTASCVSPETNISVHLLSHKKETFYLMKITIQTFLLKKTIKLYVQDMLRF